MYETLEATDLQKTYGQRAVVKNVSIRVIQGETVGLLGPNGAGKTTSFYMMVGLVKADAGRISIGETEVTSLPLHKRAKLGIGYLPQEASIFRELSVEQNIYSVLEVVEPSARQRLKKLEKLLEEFSIKHIQKSLGRELSGGERRRVEIARCLALTPKFVLLDEPFAGVDPLAVADIQEIIKQLSSKNIGVLITDHSVRETLGIVDRAYIMSAGELLVNGAPEEIVANETAKKFYLGEDFKM